MPLNSYIDDEDEASLLFSGISGGKPPKTKLRKQAEYLQFPDSLERNPRAVVVLVIVGLFGLWYLSSGHTASNGAAAAEHPTRPPHPRGLEDAQELQWVFDKFGVFLEHAVPAFEKANHDCHTFLNMLPQGDCQRWISVFSETGEFSISVGHLRGEYSTRTELEEAFCHGFGDAIRATKLVWHFPDSERLEGVALFEVFIQARPEEPISKFRWAQYAKLRKDMSGIHINEFRLYEESQTKPGSGLEGNSVIERVTSAIVQANLKRLNRHDCGGFEAALPSGTETWVLQSPPDGTHQKDELDDAPREKILQKCRKDIKAEWSSLDFEFSYAEAQFSSQYGREAIIFFHKERRWKGLIDVADDPEALVVKFSGEVAPRTPVFAQEDVQPAAVHSLHFYDLEAVHTCKDWSWKYGQKSHPRLGHGKEG